MASEFGIKRIDDRTIYRLFKSAMLAGRSALRKESETPQYLAGRDHQISLTLSTGLPWELDDEDLKKLPTGQFTIVEAVIRLISCPMSAQNANGRNNPTGQIRFIFSRLDSGHTTDKFKIDTGDEQNLFGGAGEKAVLRAIHQALSPLLQPVAPEDGGLMPTLSNLAEGFSVTYQRISEELSSAMAAVSKERADQLTEFQEERKRLRNEIAAERQAMQEDAKREIEERRAELESERQTLQAEWAKLEVSSHKDARRRQFSALQEDLKKSLKTPVAGLGLRATRWAVFLAFLAAGAAAGVFAFGSITAGVSMQGASEEWVFHAIRSVVLTVTALASFFGAAAWLRYFYVRDLQTQEDLRRFQNDMARASWVMEAALEIRKEHNEDIPPEWIAGVTEGLFAARKRDTLEEGAQALAALLGISASASFGPNGVSVELGKKAGKALATAAQKPE